jgi:hypothetical protein
MFSNKGIFHIFERNNGTCGGGFCLFRCSQSKGTMDTHIVVDRVNQGFACFAKPHHAPKGVGTHNAPRVRQTGENADAVCYEENARFLHPSRARWVGWVGGAGGAKAGESGLECVAGGAPLPFLYHQW